MTNSARAFSRVTRMPADYLTINFTAHQIELRSARREALGDRAFRGPWLPDEDVLELAIVVQELLAKLDPVAHLGRPKATHCRQQRSRTLLVMSLRTTDASESSGKKSLG